MKNRKALVLQTNENNNEYRNKSAEHDADATKQDLPLLWW